MKKKTAFIALLLLLSNVLSVLGNLSRTFQLAELNLLIVEQLVTDAKAALHTIKDDPLQGGYMMELTSTMQSIDDVTTLDKATFVKNAKSYVEAVITHLDNRFPEVRTLTLLGYIDPRNLSGSAANPITMLELGEKLQVDGHKLWHEYTGYRSFVKSLTKGSTIHVAVSVMHSPENKEAMALAYPLISSILPRMAVLPA